MGTRGTFGVRISGEDKLTYNHFDSYPDGLGMDILNDVRSMMDEWGIDKLKKQATNMFVTDTDVKPTAEQIKTLAPYTDLGVSEQSTDDWYCLTRNLQGSLRDLLTIGFIVEGNAFIHDSLFCEYGYIVNLDDDVLEVYEGFQKEDHDKGRYAEKKSTEFERRELTGNDNYYPCALVTTFPLDNLPMDDEFTIAINRGDMTETEMLMNYFGEYGDTLSVEQAKNQFGISKTLFKKTIAELRKSGHKIKLFPGEGDDANEYGLEVEEAA